ncbi:uncharacterized protein LOC107271193 [Cephus cinctus]|uniref:Uncharacterized protein LOC107271193 n=1 Tax=Cephus cinctus TaxID=211228 RepID=A0AAJ7C5G5_CEPCN|nr:uncharacterized protein LOC107271193 [Cephus cinctus]
MRRIHWQCAWKLHRRLMAAWLFKSQQLLARSNSDNGKGFATTRLFALRQSRWFNQDESNLFKNVLDSGYILELRIPKNTDTRNVDKDAAETLEYGIVLWIDKPDGEDKEAMVVYLDPQSDKSKKKDREIKYISLHQFWSSGIEIRINNMGDREKKPNSPEEIVDQVNRALRGSSKWHDSKAFVYWCRYGSPPTTVQENSRRRQLSDAAIRWGSISASAGALFYTSRRQRRHSERSG